MRQLREIERRERKKNLLRYNILCRELNVSIIAAFNIVLINWSVWSLSIQESTLSIQEGSVIIRWRSHCEKNRSSQLHVRARNNRARSPTCYLHGRRSSNSHVSISQTMEILAAYHHAIDRRSWEMRVSYQRIASKGNPR